MELDYKKYSLQKLNEWMHDALSCSEATPQEIYDVIKGVVSENYYIYKNHTERCYELLALLNGNGLGHIQAYDDYVTDPAGNKVKVCDKDDTSPECRGAWNDFWSSSENKNEFLLEKEMNKKREELYSSCVEGNQLSKTKTYSEMISSGWIMTDDGFWVNPNRKKDKVVKWQLPVQMDDAAGDAEPIYYVNFPDDLLEAANLKEGDMVEWIDNNDGSFTLRKV